jgi:HK97 family phage prohead protease
MRALDDAEGVAEGYITTFGNDYDIGWGLRERIAPTAFDASMAERGNVLPIMYQHDHKQPPIGVATLTRDEQGIKARTEFFMDDPRARATWRAMDAGALREWSIGFTANDTDIDRVRSNDRDVEVIQKGDLMEASVVLRGANDQTSTTSVRAEDSRRQRLEARTRELSAEESSAALAWLLEHDGISAERLDDFEAHLRAAPEPADEPSPVAPELLAQIDKPWVRELLRAQSDSSQ